MEITPYFEKIEERVISDLKAAEREILLAVAWFTNKNIFDVLIEKLKGDKIVVKLVVINDNINNRINGLDFQQFISSGGIFYFAEKNIPMHSKYVIIDSKIVITGSYNYTYLAESTNDENVIRIDGCGDIVQSYIDNFNNIVSSKKPITNIKDYLEIFPPCVDLFAYRNYVIKDIYQEAELLRQSGKPDEADNLVNSITVDTIGNAPKDFIINDVVYKQWKSSYYVDKIEVSSGIITIKFRNPLSEGCYLCSPGTRSAWLLCLSKNKEIREYCRNIKNVCVNDKVILNQVREGCIYYFYENDKRTDFSHNACGYEVNEQKQMIDSSGKSIPVEHIKCSKGDILTCEVSFNSNNVDLINGMVDFIEGNGFDSDEGHWNAFCINMALNREYL